MIDLLPDFRAPDHPERTGSLEAFDDRSWHLLPELRKPPPARVTGQSGVHPAGWITT